MNKVFNKVKNAAKKKENQKKVKDFIKKKFSGKKKHKVPKPSSGIGHSSFNNHNLNKPVIGNKAVTHSKSGGSFMGKIAGGFGVILIIGILLCCCCCAGAIYCCMNKKDDEEEGGQAPTEVVAEGGSDSSSSHSS